MIDMNIEFTRGILFIRLQGVLNKNNSKTISNAVTKLLNDGGIRMLVFNTEELTIKSNSLFNICNKIIKENDGKMLICSNNISLKNYEFVSDELTAMRRLSIC